MSTAIRQSLQCDRSERRARPPSAVAADPLAQGRHRREKSDVIWIERKEGGVARVGLGKVPDIDAAVDAYLALARRPAADPAEAAAQVAALVLAPILARVPEGVRTLHLCPDGALATLPFAALPGRVAGHLLIDEFTVEHHSAPQDLVPLTEALAAGSGTLFVGGVDYDHAAQAGDAAAAPAMAASAPAEGVADRARQGPAFRPLPGTAREVEELAKRPGGRQALLEGARATEAELRRLVPGKRILHLATHGFIRREDLGHLNAGRSHARGSEDAPADLDPMLGAGIALAGANPREGGGDDDGILTAAEATYLDLSAAGLVVLSACETARGSTPSGEGVQGLVSALQIAGARHLVASLWDVDDDATRELMPTFYDAMAPAKGKPATQDVAHAHREAQFHLRTLEVEVEDPRRARRRATASSCASAPTSAPTPGRPS